jgi:hypothetical protein
MAKAGRSADPPRLVGNPTESGNPRRIINFYATADHAGLLVMLQRDGVEERRASSLRETIRADAAR